MIHGSCSVFLNYLSRALLNQQGSDTLDLQNRKVTSQRLGCRLLYYIDIVSTEEQKKELITFLEGDFLSQNATCAF